MPRDARGEEGEATEPRSAGSSMIVEMVDGRRERDVMLDRSELLLE